MYVDPNYPSKIAVKRALQDGKRVTCFAPGLGSVPENGTAPVEGPHYPKPHRWYGVVTIKDGIVTAIK